MSGSYTECHDPNNRLRVSERRKNSSDTPNRELGAPSGTGPCDRIDAV